MTMISVVSISVSLGRTVFHSAFVASTSSLTVMERHAMVRYIPLPVVNSMSPWVLLSFYCDSPGLEVRKGILYN